MKNLFLMTLTLITTNTFADGIWFISPQPGQSVKGQMTIQIQPPFIQTNVRVWIQEENGYEQILWNGTFSQANNYTLTVDTSTFKKGRYEINAEFYHQHQDFDGDTEFWID